jgi:hypothetical protein
MARPSALSIECDRKSDGRDEKLQRAEAEIFGVNGLAIPSASDGDTISRGHSKAVLSILTMKQGEVF